MSDFGDAFRFIFETRQGPGGADVGGSQLLDLLAKHLELTGAAVALAIAIALPIGVWLGHTARGSFLAVSVSNVGRAVPSIAIIFVFFAYLGAGFANVMLALALLAIPPILTNAYVAVRAVDPDTVDAARGVGLTGMQVVRQVELPLALPLIFGGIRTSTVNVLATATIAPFAGVVTLGDPIINPTTYGDAGRLGASIVVAVLAIATEVGLGAVQRAVTPAGLKLKTNGRKNRTMRIRRIALPVLAALIAVLALSACGSSDDKGSSAKSTPPSLTPNPANKSITITVGSKNFTEQKVLGEIYAQALSYVGYNVKKALNLGDEQTALKALKGGQIDGYPEYTGTALLSFLKVKTDALPHDSQQAYQEVKTGMAKQGITALPPTPFTSSNEVAVTKATADKLGLKKISDLAGKAKDLTLYGSPECRTRTDCLLGLEQVYGLHFKKFVPIDLDQRHEVLANGDADVSIVFTTDPQVKRNKEVLLADDKGMFPPYNSTFLVKDSLAKKAGPDLAKTIATVNKYIDANVMQELNAKVDIDKSTPAAAGKLYLQFFHMIPAAKKG